MGRADEESGSTPRQAEAARLVKQAVPAPETRESSLTGRQRSLHQRCLPLPSFSYLGLLRLLLVLDGRLLVRALPHPSIRHPPPHDLLRISQPAGQRAAGRRGRWG